MLGVKKPDPEFYRRALDAIGFTGDTGSVFYADNEMPNVIAAQEMGIDAFYYTAE